MQNQTGRSDYCKVARSGHVKQPPMEEKHRPNSEEGQLYAWISQKESADQQHRHKSCSLLSTSSIRIRIPCLCMEPIHRSIITQAGNGAKEGCQVLYKHVSQYQQCDRNARRSSMGNIRALTNKDTTYNAL